MYCTVENSVKNCRADAGGGDMEESKVEAPDQQHGGPFKKQGVVNNYTGILTPWGYSKLFRGSLCSYNGMIICIV
jgi:hypothetical protein